MRAVFASSSFRSSSSSSWIAASLSLVTGGGDFFGAEKRVLDNVVLAGYVTNVRHELRDGIQEFHVPCRTCFALLLEGEFSGLVVRQDSEMTGVRHVTDVSACPRRWLSGF
jgi:hypothetical protein